MEELGDTEQAAAHIVQLLQAPQHEGEVVLIGFVWFIGIIMQGRVGGLEA
jgi:hypothetical protein